MIWLVFISICGFAGNQSKFLGHNLTPSTKTLAKGTVTIGNYISGVGVTSKVTVGTSTWMLLSYNMYNAFLRARTGKYMRWRTAFQSAYFKTGKFYPNHYDMEAVSLWGVASKTMSSHYRLYLNVNYMYFWNETTPFSLRREPHNDEPYQFSVTSLHEAKLTKRWFMAGEFGILGLNYLYPHLFLGLSARYQNKHWLFQFGVSENQNPKGIFSRLYTQDQYSVQRYGEYIDRSLHPEIQVQYFF